MRLAKIQNPLLLRANSPRTHRSRPRYSTARSGESLVTAMQGSNDSIIFQLTNIGAAQRESPVRTPKKLVTNQEGPITPPPSSKGKRWAERFAAFPRSSERRKKSVGSASVEKTNTGPHSIAISPPMGPNRSKSGPITGEPDAQYPSRTDSLPRPSLNLGSQKSRGDGSQGPLSAYNLEGLRRLQPPRVLPFGYADARASPKKSFLNCICSVCDEPIYTRSHGERIIELECSHITHQECLLVALEASHDINSDELLDDFPHCSRCRVESMRDVKCLPKNHDLKDKLISQFLLSKNLGSPVNVRRRSSGQFHPGLPSFLSSPSVTTTKQELRQSLRPTLTRSTKSAFQVPFTRDRAVRRGLLPSTPQSRSASKGSLWTGSSSLVSSANDLSSIISADVSVLEKSQKGPLETTQLPILRACFTEMLLANFGHNIVNWKVDAMYGLLRLVDKLAVSNDGSNYSTCLCYLFERALVTATLENEVIDNLIDTKLSNLRVYKPISGVKVEAVESSVFKCTISSDAGHQELFLTEELNTDTSQIIQKWISGLLNHDFIFDETSFTSTLPIPPILRQLKGREDRNSLIGMVGSSKIIELTGLDQLSDSVIVRRGVKLPPMNSEAGNELETMENVMTTISSILSLKRDKPDDLIAVLQCDLSDSNFTESLLIIQNSIKALDMKFRTLKVCIVDSEGYVVQYALANQILFDAERIASLKCSDSCKFSPNWLRNAFNQSKPLENVGIAIVSGTQMEEGKSCLFMDYRPFTCTGRRRPNELKVKVGYLNVDYSDSIEELVEVASWTNILEALSYSFSLMFGDDEDEDLSDSSDCDLNPFEEATSTKSESLLDLDVTNTGGSVEGESAGRCSMYSKEQQNGSDFSNSKEGIMNQEAVDVARPMSLSAKPSDKGWDPLLDDIESAIRELQRGRSISPRQQSSHFYTYM